MKYALWMKRGEGKRWLRLWIHTCIFESNFESSKLFTSYIDFMRRANFCAIIEVRGMEVVFPCIIMGAELTSFWFNRRYNIIINERYTVTNRKGNALFGGMFCERLRNNRFQDVSCQIKLQTSTIPDGD